MFENLFFKLSLGYFFNFFQRDSFRELEMADGVKNKKRQSVARWVTRYICKLSR